MAETRLGKQTSSISGRPFFKAKRALRGGHSRASINAALAIPATAAPLAAEAAEQQKPLRHGRKRRRHRYSSFSSSSLPPAVAAALAIKSPDDAEQPEVDASCSTAVAAEPDEKPPSEQPSCSGASLNGQSAAAADAKKRKKRSRRKRRHWKPYFKLSAEERRELEEREERRAERSRAQRFRHGQPVAPYNTTQFLLQDRELRNGEPDCGNLDEIVRNIRQHTRSGSYESASESVADNSSEFSDRSYLEREFDNDWLDEQKQRLEGMSKDDLVRELMDLQKQYETAQRNMRTTRLLLEEEVGRLRSENDRLRGCAEVPRSMDKPGVGAGASSHSSSGSELNSSSSTGTE